jgi:tol-pal system protein YbgF
MPLEGITKYEKGFKGPSPAKGGIELWNPIGVEKGGWRVKIICRLVWIGLIFIMLAGCATREDILILDRRTSSLERNLSQIKDANEETKTKLSRRIEQSEKKMDSQLNPVLQNQADSGVQQEALKEQIQILQGRIEALEHNQKKEQTQLSDSLSKDLKDLQARVQRLEKPSPPTPSSEPGPKPEKGKEITRESKEESKETKEPAKEKEKAKSSPEEIYKEADALLKKQAYEGAQKKYEEYLKAAPKGKYFEEARFGLAESIYGSKDYEEAILSYQKLVKSYPKSKHIPEALYKQALSFIHLKDTGSARLLLEKIVKEYPKSSKAKPAQQKLKSL